MYDNDFEKFPGSKAETSGNTIPPEQDFDKSFEKGVPEFAGNQFGIANKSNEFYGETVSDDESENEAEFNDGLSNAASIINYGLDAAARETSVEAVIQGIKNFDASSSDNPLRDLYDSLGIDTKKEFEDMHDESVATKHYRNQFREQYNMPKTEKRSREGFIKAIMDMKELISEVEGADSRYEKLRQAASASGKGYFEYAVKDYGLRGLTDLFSVLAKQKAEKPKNNPNAENLTETTPKSNIDSVDNPEQIESPESPEPDAIFNASEQNAAPTPETIKEAIEKDPKSA